MAVALRILLLITVLATVAVAGDPVPFSARAGLDLAADGGSAADVAPVSKAQDDMDIDFAALAPKPI